MLKKKQGRQASMKKVREVFRLRGLNFSQREIARSLGIAKSSVSKYLKKETESQLNFLEIENLTDQKLKEFISNRVPKTIKQEKEAKINFSYIHRELSKVGVTLQCLWEEYKETNSNNTYSYSSFCIKYRRWKQPLNATLRKNYSAGEVLFVDFSGKRISYTDLDSKEEKQAELFVATLGNSNYTYCEACESQKIKDWIQAHINAFEFFEGVAKSIVPDNLKSGVTKACIYDPDINPTYFDMAKHYDTVILPARSKKPKDKGKVEGAVLIVQRWILSKFRRMKFFSIDEINQQISPLLKQLNNKEFKKLSGSRSSIFNESEKAALTLLPEKRYRIFYYKKAKVSLDYHIQLDKNLYSVPYKYIYQYVTLRYSDTSLEVFHNNQRIASHKRSYKKHHYISIEAHRPKNHQEVLKHSPSSLRSWASGIGENVFMMVDSIFTSYKNEFHGSRKVIGILSLGKKHSYKSLDLACKKAMELGLDRLSYIKKFLKEMEEQAKTPLEEELKTIFLEEEHENVRGSKYYCENSSKEIN